MERRVIADRTALLSRGVMENLPTLGVEQASFDARLAEEPKPLEQLTPEQRQRREELEALGMA